MVCFLTALAWSLSSWYSGSLSLEIELLRPSKIRGETYQNRLIWAGGYDQEIEYTRSSLFDIYFYDLFFRTTAHSEIARRPRKHSSQ